MWFLISGAYCQWGSQTLLKRDTHQIKMLRIKEIEERLCRLNIHDLLVHWLWGVGIGGWSPGSHIM